MTRLWKYDAALGLAIAALYADVVFGARIIGRDVLHYLIPVGAALHDGYVGQGSLLWDSGIDHGLPVIARWAPMVFYPGQWLHAVMRPETAVTLGVVLHLFLGACAVLRLATRFTAQLPAAWVAAMAYTCGGYVICVTVSGGYLFGATLLPLSLLCFFRLAEKPGVARVPELAAVLSLQILCADPQTLFYEGLVLAPLILAFHQRTQPGMPWKRFAFGAAAVAIAVAVTACQWLPSVEFTALSVRAEGIATRARHSWAFHPLRVVQWVSPHVFGSVTPESTFWARSLVNADLTLPWAPHVYLGLPIIAGCALAERRRQTYVLVALTAFFLVLAFGPWGFVYETVARVLPGASLFRYPEKFLLFVSLGLCLLGASGLGVLLPALTVPSARVKKFFAAQLAGIGVAALAVRLWLDPASAVRQAWFAEVVREQGARVDPNLALSTVASSLVHTAAMGLAFAAFCLAAARLRPALVVGLGGLLVAGDVVSASLTQRYVADAAPYQVAPAACGPLAGTEAVPKPLVWRYADPLYFADINGAERGGTRFERQREWDWDTLRANIGSMTCIRQADGYEAGRLHSYRRLWESLDAQLARRLDLFGVEKVIAAPGTLDPAVWPEVFGSVPLRAVVHDVPRHLAYASGFAAAQRASSVDAAVQRLVDPAFDPRAVLLADGDVAIAEHGPARRDARVTAHRSGAIAIATDFEAPGYLMLQETYYPGWQAAIDGAPTPVFRAHAHFLGLAVPRGTHAVTLAFDPPIQHRANAISIAGLVLLAASAAFARRRSAP